MKLSNINKGLFTHLNISNLHRFAILAGVLVISGTLPWEEHVTVQPSIEERSTTTRNHFQLLSPAVLFFPVPKFSRKGDFSLHLVCD